MVGTKGTVVGQASLDVLPYEVAIIDADGVIAAVNDTWRTFADQNQARHPDYWVNENYFDFCEGDEDTLATPDVATQLRATISGEQDQYQHEYPCHSPDEQRWFRLDARRFQHNGDPYLLVVHTNITDQKFAQIQAEARAEQLETILRVLTHDLRNPLNIIDGYVDLLAADIDDADTIDTIKQAIVRITEITEATIAFTNSGTLTESEPLSIADLARRAWQTVETADATLTIEDSPRVIGDRRLLLQLFENLFRNPIEHAGRNCNVRVGGVDGGFYVEDDGPGVPAAIRQKASSADYST